MSDSRDDILNYINQYVLQKDEKIVWKGRPTPSRCASVGLFQSFFGIFFFGFAIVWTVMASKAEEAGFFPLFGIPFMAVGAWMVSGPLRHYRWGKRTYYAITNNRILIVTTGSVSK